MKTLVYCLFCLIAGIVIGHNLADPVSVANSEPVAREEVAEPSPKLKAHKSISEDSEAESDGLKVGYHLQVGSFAKDYFLNRMKANLHQKGYTVNSHRMRMKKVLVEVVEVGPFNTLPQAEKHAGFIEKEFGIKKVVIRKRVNE